MSQINIVGAGLSGLSFAIKARLGGENVTLFDKSAAPIMSSGLSSNVISINKRSARFLKSLDSEQKYFAYKPVQDGSNDVGNH